MSTRSTLVAGIAGAIAIGVYSISAQAQGSIDAAVTAADATAGLAVSFQCIGCHSFGEGEAARVGPNLFGVVGRAVASVDGFTYSSALLERNATGETWTLDVLDAYLAGPQQAVPGTTMQFPGVSSDTDRHNLLAYLASLAAAN